MTREQDAEMIELARVTLSGQTGLAVLIAEGDPPEQARLAKLFRDAGHRVIGASTIDASRSLLREFPVHVAFISEDLVQPDPVGTVGDLIAVLSAWGSAGGPEDLDGSGTVDVADLIIVLINWGSCP